jgi:hypothetical protein
MSPKEVTIILGSEKEYDALSEHECPYCGANLKSPEFYCERCKIILTFIIKNN